MQSNTSLTKRFLLICSLFIWGILGILISYHTLQRPGFAAKQQLAKRFLLTDYCLSTESRHTRHLNFPELIAPFQDVPGGHDHFPSSSFLFPDPSRFQQGFSEK